MPATRATPTGHRSSLSTTGWCASIPHRWSRSTARSPSPSSTDPHVALALVDRLPIEGYHAFHATRAEMLRRLGRSDEAREAYDRAIELAGNTAESAYLTRRRSQLGAPDAK